MKSRMEMLMIGTVILLAIAFFPAMGGAAEPIKIVDLNPISGVMKDIGDRYQLGIKFAVEEVTASGGIKGRPIMMFYDDSQV